MRLDFAYDGGGVGKGGKAVLTADGAGTAEGRVEATIPYYFAFDETFDIGVDRASPVVDDYAPVDNAFTGTLRTVRFDLGDDQVSDVEDVQAAERFRAAHD